MKSSEIPVYEIYYESKVEKVYSKTIGKAIMKKVPTDKGVHQILGKIKQLLRKKKISYNNSYFRIFDHSRMDCLLAFGSDRANQLEKRKFDKMEWELYSFRLIYDFFYTDKKRRLLAYENGPLLKDFSSKNLKHHRKLGGRIREDTYSGKADKNILEYYNKILKKYKYLEKDKSSKYYRLYMKLKKVKTEFPKCEKGLQPEFFLSEKLAMKKLRLMRDDVTFAYKPSNGLGMEYILKDAIRKRVPTNIAPLAIYKDLTPVLPRITKGGYDETGLYGFKYKRINHLVMLLLLIPG